MPLPKTRWQKLMRGDTLRDVHLLDPRKHAGCIRRVRPGMRDSQRDLRMLSPTSLGGDWSKLVQMWRQPFWRYSFGGRGLDPCQVSCGN